MKSGIALLCAVLLCACWPLLATRNNLFPEQSFTESRNGTLERQNSAAAPEHVVTFDRDIAPIVFAHCSVCHWSGGSGPFPLFTYQDVKKHAQQVAFVTQNREMPPWLPDSGPFQFQGDRRLSAEQIGTIRKWIEQGEVEGDPQQLPGQPRVSNGWQLGKPDLILRPDQTFALPAGGADQYWNFVLRLPTKRTRWLRAMEVLPEDNRILRQATLALGGRSADGQNSAAKGFPGMEFKAACQECLPLTHLFFWQPGTPTYVYPDTMSMRLEKGTEVILSVHLQPSGKPERVQPRLGLYFAKKPATEYPMVLLMENDTTIDIPPRAKRYLVSDNFTLPADVDLLAVYPHAHYLAEDLAAFVTFPDGQEKDLIHIKHWDLIWQSVYRYESPVFLPKGTTISLRYVYNNSEGNVSNPNYPPKRVLSGEGIADEMSHLWLQVLPRRRAGEPDPRALIEQALANHKLQRNSTAIKDK